MHGIVYVLIYSIDKSWIF